jgi:hypothetical protein
MVDVVVTTPAGSVTLSNGYKYANAPSLLTFTPNRVPSAGGTAITIGGSGFTFAEDIEIDGIGVPFTIVNDTTITFTSPPHAAGPIPVLARNFAGSSSMGPAITFVDAPLVSVAAPNTGTAAGGTVVTITGTRFTGVHSVLIGGQPASFAFNSDEQITATTPAHAAEPTDIVIEADGGSGTLVASFTYLAVGTATTLGSSANPAMRGTLITFTATVTPAASTTPTGSVAFEASGTLLGTVALAGGTATFATDALPVGTTGIVARYLGDASHAATSSTQLDQVITERPGTLSLTVESGVDGQAFDSISATPALNLTTVTAAGRAQSGPISLAAGSYAVTLSDAGDYGMNLASIDCGSGASVDLNARTATVTINPDSAISCIFRLADIKALTTDLIGEFLQLRGSLMLVNQPDIQRRIDRAAGRTSGFSSPLPMLMQYLGGPASRGQIDVSAALSSFDAL